jgi:hypothetical protein
MPSSIARIVPNATSCNHVVLVFIGMQKFTAAATFCMYFCEEKKWRYRGKE